MQPQGSMRMDHSKETLTIKMQVLPFKGGKLVDGAPMAKYPEYDPPGGGRWIYSGVVKDWGTNRPTKAQMLALSTRIPEWAVFPV